MERGTQPPRGCVPRPCQTDMNMQGPVYTNADRQAAQTAPSQRPGEIAALRNPLDTEPAKATVHAPEHSRLDVSDATIKRVGSALFLLWLKIAATILVGWLVVLIWPVIILLILSLMLVATFNPLVRRLQQRITRAWAITLVAFGIVASGAGLLVMMIPPLVRQARNLLTNLPQYLSQIESAARQMGIKVRLHGSSLDLSKQAANLPETWNV